MIEAIKNKNISKTKEPVTNLYKLVEIDLDTLQMNFWAILMSRW